MIKRTLTYSYLKVVWWITNEWSKVIWIMIYLALRITGSFTFDHKKIIIEKLFLMHLNHLLWHCPVVWFSKYLSQQTNPLNLKRFFNYQLIKIKKIIITFLFSSTCSKSLNTYPKHARFCINRNKLKEKNTNANVNIVATKKIQEETVLIESYILSQKI